MRTILVGASLSAALFAAMPPRASAADDWPFSAHLFALQAGDPPSSSLLSVHEAAQPAEAPTYAAGMRFELRYRVESTDRFDPANLKLLGGAIGGNGVKGGAVVSLSWPTEH